MTFRHQPNYANDSESLQADVMRFMAIIAFCLIAVLALVRNVEPPSAPVDARPDPVLADQQPQDLLEAPERIDMPAVVRPNVAEPQVQLEAIEAAPPLSTPAPQPAAPRVPINEMATHAEDAPAEQSLSLRFASDRDFLRLVTRGEIQVFAYKPRGAANAVLGLDRNFEFLSAQAPGQIYELMPQTIPNLIAAALDRATPEASTYSWGIRMPQALESKIRGFIDRNVHGELVIDRYGEVHHVAT